MPLRCPGPGWVTIPASLFTTTSDRSSNTMSRGMSSGWTVRTSGGGTRTSMRWPASSRLRLACDAPVHQHATILGQGLHTGSRKVRVSRNVSVETITIPFDQEDLDPVFDHSVGHLGIRSTSPAVGLGLPLEP